MSRYIDADNLHNAKFQDVSGYGENVAYRVGWNDAIDAICENEPSIDIVPCQACKWYEDPNHKIFENCVKWKDSHGIILPTKPNDFCSYGEREGE